MSCVCVGGTPSQILGMKNLLIQEATVYYITGTCYGKMYAKWSSIPVPSRLECEAKPKASAKQQEWHRLNKGALERDA